MNIVYLHGFASSPRSGKAQFFKRQFEDRGVRVDIPELDRGDFQGMTISGTLEVVRSTVASAGHPCVLMGSSLGGFIAGLYAARYPDEVERLVLLAPALSFAERWGRRYTTDELAEWKRQGSKSFYHYGRGREAQLGYTFVQDAMGFEGEPQYGQPTLILHGTADDVVPVELSRGFARRHANCTLVEFSSGHELTDVTEGLWRETAAFLRIP